MTLTEKIHECEKCIKHFENNIPYINEQELEHEKQRLEDRKQMLTWLKQVKARKVIK